MVMAVPKDVFIFDLIVFFVGTSQTSFPYRSAGFRDRRRARLAI
jgi:hypothetical protein